MGVWSKLNKLDIYSLNFVATKITDLFLSKCRSRGYVSITRFGVVRLYRGTRAIPTPKTCYAHSGETRVYYLITGVGIWHTACL